ncbi:MAG TPA: hypothetical protein VMF87_32025 [Streptosporangiaceae bacterium]|nr:hypothetical protein [Streptosporangiaceae bacterium]
MSGPNPAPGHVPAAGDADGGLTGTRRRPGRRRSRLWLALGGAAVIVVVAIVIAALLTAGNGGPDVPAGTPNGAQLEQLLPPSQALPSGWYLSYTPKEPTTFAQPGHLPPRPLNACLDFNQGFDLGVTGDTFLSAASETALFGAGPGDGLLRADLFGVEPGAAGKAIKAVDGWVRRCSSYTVVSHYYKIHYTVTAAPVAGLGDQSLDVRVTMHRPSQPGAKLLPLTSNNTLLVRVGNSLIAIECLAPANSMIASLAGLAAPMASKLPGAANLPDSGPAAKPKPTPAVSPDLTLSQLNKLLPTTSGLPAEYYQGNPATPVDFPNPGNVPLTRPPATMTCAQLISLPAGASLRQFDVNYRSVAELSEYDPNSNGLDVAIDQVTNTALASQDISALRASALACPKVSQTEAGDKEVYKAKVTSVPGLGDQAVNVYLNPLSGTFGLPGSQDILLVRVGAALVLVDYELSTPGQAPPVTTIASRIVAKL